MAGKIGSALTQAARAYLADAWSQAAASSAPSADLASLPQDVLDAIESSTNSGTKTYRYVLPTQVLAKVVNRSLDCRSVQATSGLRGAFDARSVCHKVIVPFDRQNNNVLGGSAEPYLNNPLRIPAIVAESRHAQKDKQGFDALRLALDYVQKNPRSAKTVLRAILAAIRRRMNVVTVTYPVPNRISLKQASSLLAQFLEARSGGLRQQAIAVALFRCIGETFSMFAEVRSANINATDASTGSAADLECVDAAGKVLLAVEVKDRQLTLRQTEDKLPGVRDKGIREILFLVQGGLESEDKDAINRLIDREFVTGQNLYVCEFTSFLESCLVLFGENGRRVFLRRVGEYLDEQRADMSHRQQWRDLLGNL